jgi:hypothetical protein
MIQIKPYAVSKYSCSCGGEFRFQGFTWQGLHICETLACDSCSKMRYNSLPVNQSEIEQYSYFPDSGAITDLTGNPVNENWFSSKLKTISDPVYDEVVIGIEKRKICDEVLILNTLDYVYGHSFLYLLNLQRIIKTEKQKGIIIIVQPMLKWLIPLDGVAEIWTVQLGFSKFNSYHKVLSDKINSELGRFSKVWLSRGHIIPTNENIDIELFTGIKPYSFQNEPVKPRITLIWRQDPDRLWVRNIYLLKGLKKLGFKKILIPVQYLRTLLIFRLLRRKMGDVYSYTVAGPGKYGRLPTYINDERVSSFDEEIERKLCGVYSESILVFGVHGSGMLLPSAHAGMTLSLMPSKRWGNFAEDILFTENDARIALFQKRVIPLNLSVFDLRDILIDMVNGRSQYIRKMHHTDDL